MIKLAIRDRNRYTACHAIDKLPHDRFIAFHIESHAIDKSPFTVECHSIGKSPFAVECHNIPKAADGCRYT